jgi:four helix bundle protein
MRPRFDAYEVSLEIIRELVGVLAVIKRHDRDLEKQGRRAASSIALNLKEGNRRLGKDRRYHFSVAGGSADELLGVLEVSEAFGYVRGAAVKSLRELLDRELAMTWRLTHSP